MVEVFFMVEFGVSFGPVCEGYLCDVECIAQSEATGPSLANVYVNTRVRVGTDVKDRRVELDSIWPYAKDPILSAMGERIWEEARGLYVTRELETKWAEEMGSERERRANAYADYIHDQRHG